MKSPSKCDLCDSFIDTIFIHGSVDDPYDAWAIMCPECHEEYGNGLGSGKGQMYQYYAPTDQWLKIEG